MARVKDKRILAMGRDELASAIESANIGKRDRYIAKAYWLDKVPQSVEGSDIKLLHYL